MKPNVITVFNTDYPPIPYPSANYVNVYSDRGKVCYGAIHATRDAAINHAGKVALAYRLRIVEKQWYNGGPSLGSRSNVSG